MRLVKIIGTANLMIALAVVAGYYLYASRNGFPVQRVFLADHPLQREHLTAAGAVAFTEIIVFCGFFIGKLTGSNMRFHRFICAFFGGFGLLSTTFLPAQMAVDPNTAQALHMDHVIAVYVWSSHLLYALTGPNVRDDE